MNVLISKYLLLFYAFFTVSIIESSFRDDLNRDDLRKNYYEKKQSISRDILNAIVIRKLAIQKLLKKVPKLKIEKNGKTIQLSIFYPVLIVDRGVSSCEISSQEQDCDENTTKCITIVIGLVGAAAGNAGVAGVTFIPGAIIGSGGIAVGASGICVPGIGVIIAEGGTVAGGLIGGIISGPVIPVVVVGGVGIGWLVQYLKNKKNSGGAGGGGGGGQDPTDPKDPKKDKDPKDNSKLHKNGKYVGNPKHHKNSKGNIGKPPKDGQKALDESVFVKDKKYRIGVEDGKIIKFNKHLPGEYHGFVVEDYNKLDREAKDALYEAGLIKNKTTGKISK